MENIQGKKASTCPITDLLQKLKLSSDLANSNCSISSCSVPSTSGRVSHESHGMSCNMNPGQEEITENKDSDSPKKKNRRRERHRKKHLNLFQQIEANLSASSTPSCSPHTSNHGTFSPVNNTGQVNREAEKRGNVNNFVQSEKAVPDTSRREHKTKKTSLDRALERAFGQVPSNNVIKPIAEQRHTFKIYPVKRPENSYLFRTRGSKHKYVNLKSFIDLSKTKVFQTRIRCSLDNLELSDLSKIKRRKYPVKIEDNIHVGSSSSSASVSENQETLVDLSQQEVRSREAEEEHVETLTRNALVVEDRSVQVKQESNQGSQTSSPKKGRRPKKEKHRQNKLLKKEARQAEQKFPEYITEQEVKDGLKKGDLIKGLLRVNPKNSRDSYVSNEDTSQSDYYITSIADRNRGLDGDEVVLRVKPEPEWSEGKKTATVVYLLNKNHPRTAIGNLKPMEGTQEFASFYPRDKRVPIMHVPSVSWPNGFKANPKLYQNILFEAKLLEWNEPQRALGVVTEALGLSGDLKVETLSILKEFCLDVTPFSPEMVQYLPKLKEIPQKELEGREDIRKECIFTIDPLTARDLDDAVSVKELPNGNYEIGVHISDASYYLHEGTSLDQMVCKKGTTIYLVDSVYHMLPVELCLHCSLLPGEDKLAFSVFWEMDESGDIFNTRFARTVLNSCTQLAYEHAQQMIENPDKEFKKDELPQIYNGFTYKDLSKTVNVLQRIAINLRDARLRNGSLRIDQVKLLFSLNPRNGEPLEFIEYENKESHRLIEEFMLLANISVATRIQDSFPDIAFLRCHEPPKGTMLIEAQKCLETCGIHIDVSSSGSLHSSLRKYITDDYQGFCRGIVLNHIFAKPMSRARYFCSATMDTEMEYAHYALSVPIYTHFTSPIRRYADIMVHRLLAASLGYADKPNWNMDQVCAIAANCNKQKYNAKRAGEASSDLYLAHYIEKHQPYIQECVVVDVKDRSFDVIVLKTGSHVRVYQKKCEDDPSWQIEEIPSSTRRTVKKDEHEKKVLRLTIKFPKTKKNLDEQIMVVEMFSVVKVKLKRAPNSYKLEAYLLRPIMSRTFDRSSSSSTSR